MGKRLSSSAAFILSTVWYYSFSGIALAFSKELQATAEFQSALDAINANRAAEIQVQEQEKEQLKRDFQIDMAQKASDTVFSIMSNNRNAELNMTLSDLEKQRERELDNKNLTKAQKKAINDK